jgi:hypothetical protein
MRISAYLFAALLPFIAGVLQAAERTTITGKVTDTDGHPLDRATILVYKAGVKKGYSTFCPTCYVDCGKHAVTGADGTFTLNSLSPDLLFTLLVIHDGNSTATVNKVDPDKGPAEPVVLKARAPIEDTSRVVRGHVVDLRGNALRGAVVEQEGIMLRGPNGMMQAFGDRGWTDLVAVTNEQGDFEMAYEKPAEKFILSVSARAMAPKLFTEPTGAERKTMTVEQGATIRGRLMLNGKPVGNAEVGVITHSRRSGTGFAEIRIGTQEDGTFAITNIPAGRVWMVYPKMTSLAERGIGGAVVESETKDNGEEVNVGDIALAPAHNLSGKVVLTDGKPIPEGMHITISADRAFDSQTLVLSPDGQFKFTSLPSGVFGIGASVKGYESIEGWDREVLVKSDVNDLVISLRPLTKPSAPNR